MTMDRVRRKYWRIFLGAILIQLGVPFASWYVARKLLDMRTADAIGVAIFVALICAGIGSLIYRYLEHRFWRSFAKGPTWTSLSRYAVGKKPDGLSVEWQGFAMLEEHDIGYALEAGASPTMLYLNIVAFGRLAIPWLDIACLRSLRVPTSDGWSEAVAIQMSEVEAVDLVVSWDKTAEGLVPKSVGVS